MRPILFDLDGVLARFTDAANAHHKIPNVQPTTWNFHHAHGITDEQFYAGMDASFWAGLGRWEDGFALLASVIARVGIDRVAFLTSPCQTEGCETGKRRWAKEHLAPLGFDPFGDVFIGGNKRKLAGRGFVLVEDSDSNAAKWRDAGAEAWLIPRPWNASDYLCAADGMFDAEKEIETFTKWWEGLQ